MRSCLALVMVLSAGCGVDLATSGDDPAPSEHGALSAGVTDHGEAPRLLPRVCGAYQWTTVSADSKDSDLAVVQVSKNIAVLSVPRSGGALRGFLVDGRGELVGNLAGTKIRSDGSFTRLSAGIADGLLVASLVDGNTVSVTAIRDDLGAYREIGTQDGDVIADAPVLHVRGQRISLSGGNTGMIKGSFGTGWQPMTTDVIARSVPNAMTGAAYGDDAMLAWSTDTDCHLQRVASHVEGVQQGTCRNPRLATSLASGGGALVWEGGENVMITEVTGSHAKEFASTRVLRAGGQSPRIVWDGAHYWVSYLDFHHGNLVAGYIDERGTLVSTALEDTSPFAEAHDLVVINNAVWTFSIDGAKFSARRMCLE